MGRLNKRYRGESPTKKCILLIEDLIFFQKLIEKFRCLQVGTIASKSEALANITIILDPDFIFGFLEKNIDRYEYIYKKGLRIFAADVNIASRIERTRSEGGTIVEDTIELVVKFFEEKENFIKNDPRLNKYLIWYKFEIKDIINQRNLTAFNRQVYAFDTTKIADGFELTIVIDHSSRKIMTHIVTANPPKSSDLIEMFRSFLTPELKSRCRVIHCDRCGSNISSEFVNFVINELNVQLSFTIQPFRNQVVEGMNKHIQGMLNDNEFINRHYQVSFQELPYEDKLKMVELVIYNTNNMKAKNDSALVGSTRQIVDEVKETIRNVNPEAADNSFIIAKTGTKEGNFLTKWTKTAVGLYGLDKDESYIFRTRNIYLPLNKEEDVKQLQDVCLSGSNEILDQIIIEQENKRRLVKLTLEQKGDITPDQDEAQNILNKLKSLLIQRLNNAKTEKERGEVEYEIGLLALSEKRQYESNSKIDALRTMMEEERKEKEIEREEKKQLFGELTAIRDLILEDKKSKESEKAKKEKRIERSKILKEMKTLEPYAIMPEEFPLILEVVDRMCVKPETRAKYRILHTYMKATGAKVGSAQSFTYTQMLNFINRKTIYIKLSKQDNRHSINGMLPFPYVKGLERYIKLIKDDVELLVNLKNHRWYSKKNTEKTSENEPPISEVFGNTSRLCNTVNEHLREAGKLMKPQKLKLTSQAYRRGIAIISIRTIGVIQTNYLLGHEKLASTESYIKAKPDVNRLKSHWDEVHKIYDAKDIQDNTNLEANEEDFNELMEGITEDRKIKKIRAQIKKERTERKREEKNNK